MKITIFLSDPNCWFTPWAQQLYDLLTQEKHDVAFAYKKEEIKEGDIAFYISCYVIIPPKILALHKHNLVCHPSDLPKGRGMSPLTWQILEGKNDIVLTLFEAAEKVDAGKIYLQETMHFDGTELNDDLKKRQGDETLALCIKFIHQYPDISAREQTGEPTFYAWRKPDDSKLDVNKTIAEQFNLLRVVDNERYPAYFEYLGKKYMLKIYS